MLLTHSKPTEEEIGAWILSTLQHCVHVEYFLQQLGLGDSDPERPHDIIGPGNKYCWDVIKGLSLQNRYPKINFKTHIKTSLLLHRQQYHHRKWNLSDPNGTIKPPPTSSNSDMLVGAIDAVCSLLENRKYQGGSHSYDSIIEVASSNAPHKTPWMLKVIKKMRKIEQPNLVLINSINEFPNIGLDEKTYRAITRITWRTITGLRLKFGYFSETKNTNQRG